MYPSSFEYHRAETAEDAVRLLSQLGPGAKLLAGGHSLLPLLKLRFAQPEHLIDIREARGLSGIRKENGFVLVGATTTHRSVENSPMLREELPALSEAAAQIGDPMVRNMGTVGGSLAHADPAADLPAVMLALNAEMRALGPEGSRTIPAGDFFQGMFTSALSADEVLTEVRIPVRPPGSGCAYVKFPHPASRYALVGVAVQMIVKGGVVEAVKVALTGVGAIAVRATGVEEALTGQEPTEAAIEAASARAADGLEPQADLQGSAEYKKNLARVYTRRALREAVARTGD